MRMKREALLSSMMMREITRKNSKLKMRVRALKTK
jgi:hypothetical protein